MPPKEELLRPFTNTVCVSHGKTKVVLEWIGTVHELLESQSFFWFRRQGAPVEELFFGVVEPSFEQVAFTSEEIREFAEYWVSLFWSLKRCYRVVWLSEKLGVPADSWFALRPERAGLVTGSGSHYANWNSPKFGLMAFDFVQNAPQQVLENWVERATTAEPARWQNAVRWACMEPEERFWSLVSWQQGGEREWMTLMRALLQLDLTDELLEEQHTWQIHFPWQLELLTSPTPLQMSLREMRPPLLTLMEVTWAYFGAFVDYSQYRVRRHVQTPFSPMLFVPEIAMINPTSHEHMEAIELWREFGRESGQLPQVENCLRQLLT